MREQRRTDVGPNLEPGQIWLIEQSAATSLFTLDRGAFAGADAVLYDRALASLVALLLPLGGYAEPLSADAGEAEPVISPRALKLAADGWGVVQLIEPCRRWRRRLRHPRQQLGLVNGAASPAIELIAKGAAGRWCRREARVPDLPELVDALAEDELLTLILGPLAGGAPGAAHAFVGNGLTG